MKWNEMKCKCERETSPRCLKGTRVEGVVWGAGWSRVKGYIKKEKKKRRKRANERTNRSLL
jgi:hypothetical protein